MKKSLLSLLVLAAFSVTAQAASPSQIEGSSYIEAAKQPVKAQGAKNIVEDAGAIRINRTPMPYLPPRALTTAESNFGFGGSESDPEVVNFERSLDQIFGPEFAACKKRPNCTVYDPDTPEAKKQELEDRKERAIAFWTKWAKKGRPPVSFEYDGKHVNSAQGIVLMQKEIADDRALVGPVVPVDVKLVPLNGRDRYKTHQ